MQHKCPRPKVLLIMEQCNPEWASVPLVASHFYQGIRQLAEVTLVTHARNEQALERVKNGHVIDYVHESPWIKTYYSWMRRLTSRSGTNWPLQHVLTYPVYAQFNSAVYKRYAPRVRAGHYDLVHAMTPILPRYPVKMVKACSKTPFVLGPVNGGVPFPPGFSEVAKREFAQYNVLRSLTKLLPGYAATYRQAGLVLPASTFTRDMVQSRFSLPDTKIELFHENGVSSTLQQPQADKDPRRCSLLFVGRLVPYKGADMALEALSRVPQDYASKVDLTIVGDGPEMGALQALSRDLGLSDRVRFTGWIPQEETSRYYLQADVFCFPSVREFGGAVALEAMAHGLPCIVPDYAGLGEYVPQDAGLKIEPRSRDFLVGEIAEAMTVLASKPDMRRKMADKALARAKEYLWSRKAQRMVDIYRRVLECAQ